MTDTLEGSVPKKRGRGRPKKAEIEKAKKPGVIGRPKGTASILKEYQARMLASPKSEAVLTKVLDTALNDEHPHQAACMKLVMDRILPIAGITHEFEKAGGKPQVNINITGIKGGVEIEGTTVDNNDQT